MTDQLSALLAETPGLERASRLRPTRIPVLDAFGSLLPEGGLKPGSIVGVSGVGATSLALAVVARATHERWTATVGMASLGLGAAAELGVDLERIVSVPDPGGRWTDVLAAVIDAFDIVLAQPPPLRATHKIAARVREHDAVLVVVGRYADCDVSFHGAVSTWRGLGRGYGRLSARTLEVDVIGRGGAARPRRATLWLPDADGEVSLADSVVPFRRTG